MLYYLIVITLGLAGILAAYQLLKEHIRDLLSWLMMCTLGIVVGLVLRRNANEQKKMVSSTTRPDPAPHLPTVKKPRKE